MRAIVRVQTQAYRFLEIIAISGEYPADKLSLIFGESRYQEKVTAELKEINFIKMYHKDRLWGYRLTLPAKRFLLNINRERFLFYLDGAVETNVQKSELNRRIRLHAIAEVTVLMLQSGVMVYRDMKWKLFSPEWNQDCIHDFPIPLFYNSRELKEISKETEKIKNARAVGVLFTGTERYIVYNTGNTIIKWQPKSELRMKAVISFHGSLHQNGGAENMKAIMFGDDLETAYRLLTSKGGHQNNYFRLDETFEHMYFITLDKVGMVSLKLLCDAQKRTELNLLLSADLQPKINLSIEYDALDYDAVPVLFAYDFDMPRIVRFCSALELRDQKGAIICFDYQKEVLSQFCGCRVTIQTIDFDKFERRFFSEK